MNTQEHRPTDAEMRTKLLDEGFTPDQCDALIVQRDDELARYEELVIGSALGLGSIVAIRVETASRDELVALVRGSLLYAADQSWDVYELKQELSLFVGPLDEEPPTWTAGDRVVGRSTNRRGTVISRPTDFADVWPKSELVVVWDNGDSVSPVVDPRTLKAAS